VANGWEPGRDEPIAWEREINMQGVTTNNQNPTMIKAVKAFEQAGRSENDGAQFVSTRYKIKSQFNSSYHSVFAL
jgi:hypothetical protein